MPSQEQQDIERLARLTLEHQRGDHVFNRNAFEGVVSAICRDPDDTVLGLPNSDAVTVDDIQAGLRLLDGERRHLDWEERQLIEAAKDRGATWEALGAALGRSGQALQQRYKRLGGAKTWPSPPPRRTRRAEPSADTQPAPVTVTYSVRTAADDGWREVGRTPELDATPVLAAVRDERVTVKAGEWGIDPGADVKIAVLDRAGKQLDAFTTKALDLRPRAVCGDSSVSGGCVRPPGHTAGHSMYPILDDPGATPIEELIAKSTTRKDGTTNG